MLLFMEVAESLLGSINLDLLLLVGVHLLPFELHFIFLLLDLQPPLQILDLILKF